MTTGKVPTGKLGSRSHCIHSQEAEMDGCLGSISSLYSIQEHSPVNDVTHSGQIFSPNQVSREVLLGQQAWASQKYLPRGGCSPIVSSTSVPACEVS